MMTTFQLQETWDTRQQYAKIETMEAILRAFSSGDLPNDDYTLVMLTNYVQSLVNGMSKNPSGVIYRCWTVMPPDMPSDKDARVDFIFTPSHIAVATLSLFQQRYVELAATINGFSEALDDGYLFSAITRFKGAGYDSADQQIRTLELLSLANIPKMIAASPLISVPLAVVLYEAKLMYLQALATGMTKAGFGRTDYSERYQYALTLF